MLYRPRVSLDQAGYLPIPIQKGERGQKIYREEKKGRPGRGRGNLFPDLLSFRSALHCAALAWSRLPRFSSRPIKKTQKKVNIQLSNLVPRSLSVLPWPWEIWVRDYQLS